MWFWDYFSSYCTVWMLTKYSPGCTFKIRYYSATAHAPCSLSSGFRHLWHTGGRLLALHPLKQRQAFEPVVYHSCSTFGYQWFCDLALLLTTRLSSGTILLVHPDPWSHSILTFWFSPQEHMTESAGFAIYLAPYCLLCWQLASLMCWKSWLLK